MKHVFLIVAMVCATAYAGDCVSPESQGVASAAVEQWVSACERDLDAVHGFVIRRHGKVIAEGTWAPFDTLNETHMLYSHSKSFTSTAIGFLVDDKQLDIDERVVDIFSECVPENPSENLRQLRVRDLLTMNVGADYTDAERKDINGNWVKAFLGNTIDRQPGTGFKYDSGATFMLSAIVRKKTGKDLMQLLDERLFRPLGFGKVWSGTAPDGTACGGWGMNMTTRDLAKFGELYLREGMWEGRRIISRDWVRLASALQTRTDRPGTGDWSQGYGFQFWRCRHGAYRADGASGQLTVVFPEQDAVVSVHAGLGDMQKELDVMWDNLLPAFGAHPLPEDPAAVAKLRARCASLRLSPLAGSAAPAALPMAGTLDKPALGFKSPVVAKDGAGWTLEENGRRLPVGNGTWAQTDWEFTKDLVEPLFVVTSTRKVAASGAWTAPGEFKVRWYVLGGIQKGVFTVKAAR